MDGSQDRCVRQLEEWKSCPEQTDTFPKAWFKSFKTRPEAEQAFALGWQKFYGKSDPVPAQPKPRPVAIGERPVTDSSICVDAAWNTQTGVVEYRCVETSSGKDIFRMGPFEEGTINVGKFLALVHGLG